jgi:hypothetical protein
MATSQRSIATLFDRIDKLARQLNPAPVAVAVVQIPEWLDRDAVLERHYRLYPRDAAAEQTVIVAHLGEPGSLDKESTRSSCAWMQIAALEAASTDPHELRLRRGRQALANLVRSAHVAPRDLGCHAFRVHADYGLEEQECLETCERCVEPGDRPVLREGFEFTRAAAVWRARRKPVGRYAAAVICCDSNTTQRRWHENAGKLPVELFHTVVYSLSV